MLINCLGLKGFKTGLLTIATMLQCYNANDMIFNWYNIVQKVNNKDDNSLNVTRVALAKKFYK